MPAATKTPSHMTSPAESAPKVAEWIVRLFGNRKPLGFHAGDSNLYRYVENKSTMLADPSGLQGRAHLIVTLLTLNRRDRLQAYIDRAEAGDVLVLGDQALSYTHYEMFLVFWDNALDIDQTPPLSDGTTRQRQLVIEQIVAQLRAHETALTRVRDLAPLDPLIWPNVNPATKAVIESSMACLLHQLNSERLADRRFAKSAFLSMVPMGVNFLINAERTLFWNLEFNRRITDILNTRVPSPARLSLMQSMHLVFQSVTRGEALSLVNMVRRNQDLHPPILVQYLRSMNFDINRIRP